MYKAQNTAFIKISEIILFLLSWSALAVQTFIAKVTVITLLSYFTILSNLMVALSTSIVLFVPTSRAARFVERNTVKSAITLYIFIVGLVYNLILRALWAPTGWNWIADNLLHVVVPIFYVGYWIISTPKMALNWKNGITWTYFPLIYLGYSLLRGSIINWYPYPFLDVKILGYAQVSFNIIFVFLAFLVIGSIMIWFNRSITSKNKH